MFQTISDGCKAFVVIVGTIAYCEHCAHELRLPPYRRKDDVIHEAPPSGLDHGPRSTLRQPSVDARDVSESDDRITPDDAVLMTGETQADGLSLHGVPGVHRHRKGDETEFLHVVSRRRALDVVPAELGYRFVAHAVRGEET